MPISFKVLESLNYRYLAGILNKEPLILDKGPLIREAYKGLKVLN